MVVNFARVTFEASSFNPVTACRLSAAGAFLSAGMLFWLQCFLLRSVVAPYNCGGDTCDQLTLLHTGSFLNLICCIRPATRNASLTAPTSLMMPEKDGVREVSAISTTSIFTLRMGQSSPDCCMPQPVSRLFYNEH